MANKAGITGSGIVVSWGAVHKRGGRLVARHVSVSPPRGIRCATWACLWKYLKDSWYYTWIIKYHNYRLLYAEAYPDVDMAWKYRTGEDAPETITSAMGEIAKLQVRRLGTWLSHKNPLSKVTLRLQS